MISVALTVGKLISSDMLVSSILCLWLLFVYECPAINPCTVLGCCVTHSYVSATRKVVVGAVLAVLIGIEVHQTSENSRLRNSFQTLQQQQEVLTERNAALEAEHVATNQLAPSSTAQVQTTELLRLRAEVTRVRRGASPEAALCLGASVVQIR